MLAEAVKWTMTRTKKGPAGDRNSSIRVLFVLGFGPVARDPGASRRLYAETLGLEFEDADGYLHTEGLEGAKTFAIWPLTQAAESCFGTREWPKEVPIPQAWLEFDVEDLNQTTKILVDEGYRLLVQNRKEPWGQTVTRLLSPEGLLVGVTFTPQMRKP